MLEIKHLTKKFDEQILFEDLSVSFPEKGLIGVVGESGCGKSTLLNILSGLDLDYQGRIFIDGIDLKKMEDLGQYRKDYIAFVYQNYRLFEYMDVYHNCLVYCWIKGIRYHNQELEKLLDYFELASLKDKKVCELSGGQKQRVAFIRAIICHCPILLLDEPTAALNDENKKLIFSYLKTYSQKHLIIMISHDQHLLKSYTTNIIDFNHLKHQYFFSNPQYAYFYPDFHKSQSLYYYLLYSLKNQKKKIVMILLSQIFMIVAITYMIAGLNGLNIFYHQQYQNSINHNLVIITKVNHQAITKRERKKHHYLPILFLEAGKIDKVTSFQCEPIQGLKKDQVIINRQMAKQGYVKKGKLRYHFNNQDIQWQIKEVINDHITSPMLYYSPYNVPSEIKKQLTDDYQCYFFPKRNVEKYMNTLSHQYQVFCFALQEYQSYQEMLNLFKVVAEIFIFISVLISIVLILLVVLAILYEQENEHAMFLSNGLTYRELYKLLFKEIGGLMAINSIFSCVLMALSMMINYIFNLSFIFFKIKNLFILPTVFYNSFDLYVICFLVYFLIGLVIYVISFCQIRKIDIVERMKEE